VFSADVETDAQSWQVRRVLSSASCVRLGALAGIAAYRPVALMKEAFVVAPYLW